MNETQKKVVKPEAFSVDYWKTFKNIYWPDLAACKRGILECKVALRRGKADKQVVAAKMQAIEELKKFYMLESFVKTNLTNREIAKILNCHESTISRTIKSLGIADSRVNRAGRKPLI